MLTEDHVARNEWCKQLGIPQASTIKSLSVLESMLLKDESMISDKIYEKIQKTIEAITSTHANPILVPLHNVTDLIRAWNYKLHEILDFTYVKESQITPESLEISIEKIIELHVKLAEKYSKLYQAVNRVPTSETLR